MAAHGRRNQREQWPRAADLVVDARSRNVQVARGDSRGHLTPCLRGLFTACWGVGPLPDLLMKTCFTILAGPSRRPPSGLRIALVLMTVVTGFIKVELSATGELRIEKTGTES